MKGILVTFATMAGSTAEIAQTVAEEIAKRGLEVEVLPLDQVQTLDRYAGIVLGAPMIMGWHRAALRFLRKNRKPLQHIPLAVFVSAMSLTKVDEPGLSRIPLTIDTKLVKAPQKDGQLTFRERYAQPLNYLKPILKAARPVTPASIGIFGGRLEYGRLKWWAVLFAMLVIQAPAGDKRNWEAIRDWAASLDGVFIASEPETT